MVPPPKTSESKVGHGLSNEGFANTPSSDSLPITPDELKSLALKLAVEITRLQASGTSDPVIQARVSILTKIKQTVDNLNTQLSAGTLSAANIPIKKSDYKNFLPVYQCFFKPRF